MIAHEHKVSVDALCRDFIAYVERVRRLSPVTVTNYKYVILPFANYLEDIDIQKLNIQQIDNIIVDYSENRGLSDGAINTARSVLRSFFQYVERYRDIRLGFDYSMIKNVKQASRKIMPLDITEVQSMVVKLHTKQDRLMMLTMFATATRISELVGIMVEDFHNNEIAVRGKGSKDRVIPLDDILSQLIQEHIFNNRLRVGPLFRHQVSKNTLPNGIYTTSGLRKRWQRQLSPYGLYKRPHDLRHGMATELLMQGMDIRTLQTFLGHSDIRTTQIYTHVTDSHLRESYLQCNPLGQVNINNMIDI